jgi:hypothetical protein
MIYSQHPDPTVLPLTKKKVAPIYRPQEIWDLGEEDLRRLIMNEYSQGKPYKCMTPQGHVIAIYPHSGEGRYDIEFTVEELVVLKNLMRDPGGKLTAYQSKGGSWVSWT